MPSTEGCDVWGDTGVSDGVILGGETFSVFHPGNTAAHARGYESSHFT